MLGQARTEVIREPACAVVTGVSGVRERERERERGNLGLKRRSEQQILGLSMTLYARRVSGRIYIH